MSNELLSFDSIIIELAVIYVGVAIIATIFLYLRQPVIISYITLGVIIGPYGLQMITHIESLENISHLGTIFLMFLIGINLHPQKLFRLLKKTVLLTIITSILFFVIISASAYIYGFSKFESMVIGIALIFSSTIVSIKLLPTIDLHNKRIGEIMISILLMQDIIAIITILLLTGDYSGNSFGFIFVLLKLIGLTTVAIILVKYPINYIIRKFDSIQEYLFILTIGWCFLIAGAGKLLGLSYEMGAFLAGSAFAMSPISTYMSEKLKSLREFFLILFFFALGAQFNILLAKEVFIIASIITFIIIVAKSLIYKFAFTKSGENPKISTELGMRLAQASEFSLLIAFALFSAGKISEKASTLIQLSVILTFSISTVLVVNKYFTPISTNPKKRRD